MSVPCSCASSVFYAIRRDIDRCVYSLCGEDRVGAAAFVRVGLFVPGIWAVIIYRLAHHFYYRFKPRSLGRLLCAPIFVASRLCGLVLGIEISPHAHIGYGLFVNHFGGIRIGEVKIGENCNVAQHVTCGDSSLVATAEINADNQIVGMPTLGNRVWVGPGAVIVGPVTIGDDAVVAGNTVVTHDIPPFCVAMGVPAEVVSKRGSFRQVTYRGMAEDRDRSAALMAQRASHKDERPADSGRAGSRKLR